MIYLAIFFGGGLGSVCRFLVSSFVGRKMVGDFPYYTLSVNLIGAFLIGVFIELLALKYSSSENLRYLLVTGFLGGFTTFSAFSMESALMWIKGDYLSLICYILSSVIGTIFLALLAMYLTKIIIGSV